MSTQRQGRQLQGRTAQERISRFGREYSRNTYVYGNAVPDIKRELEEAPKKKISQSTRKNREKAIHMNLPYVIFLVAALCVSGLVLINYIQLQSDITGSIKTISQLESQYLNMRADNEEEYARIVNAVDLNEVKRIAVEELGMHYAKEGQIVTYADEMSDYVRQYSDIDE